MICPPRIPSDTVAWPIRPNEAQIPLLLTLILGIKAALATAEPAAMPNNVKFSAETGLPPIQPPSPHPALTKFGTPQNTPTPLPSEADRRIPLIAVLLK